MASMKEIALGITTILPLPGTPNPLFIDLWNEAPSEVASLVRAVLAECHDASIRLKIVRLPTDVWSELAADEWAMVRPPETRIERSEDLHDRIEFWRDDLS